MVTILPTLEQIKAYAMQGMSFNQISRLHRMPSAWPLKRLTKNDEELKNLLLANGKSRQHRQGEEVSDKRGVYQ
jgi:hypothetical protein